MAASGGITRYSAATKIGVSADDRLSQMRGNSLPVQNPNLKFVSSSSTSTINDIEDEPVENGGNETTGVDVAGSQDNAGTSNSSLLVQ